MSILKYNQLFENKMWYKTIPQMLSWLESKSNKAWIFLDTETTGLGGNTKQQLTQISSIAVKWDFNSNTFTELGKFDEKIKLTQDTKDNNNDYESVLKFNHYDDGDYEYKEEQHVLESWFNWVRAYKGSMLIAQNAIFDMNMLGGRGKNNIENIVFDTKELIQLYLLPLLQTLAETDDKYKKQIDFIGTSSRDNGLISSSMSKIGPLLDLDMSGYHDALTDVGITMMMYSKIIDILKDNENVDIMKYQVERIKTKR